MALINCPECGSSISDRCRACPHCGFPMDEYVKDVSQGAEKNIGENDVVPVINSVGHDAAAEKAGNTENEEQHAPVNTQPEIAPQSASAAGYHGRTGIPKPDPGLYLSKLKGAAGKVKNAAAALPVKNILVFAACTVVVAAAAQTCVRIFLTPYRSAMGDYVKALNAEDILDKGGMLRYHALSTDMSADEYIEENEDDLEDYFDWQLETIEDRYGDEPKYSYDFISAKPMTDTSVEMLESAANEGREEPIEITKGITATAELTLRTDDRTKHETVCFNVVKADGEWVVCSVTDKDGDFPRLLGGFGFYGLSD